MSSGTVNITIDERKKSEKRKEKRRKGKHKKNSQQTQNQTMQKWWEKLCSIEMRRNDVVHYVCVC